MTPLAQYQRSGAGVNARARVTRGAVVEEGAVAAVVVAAQAMAARSVADPESG